MYYILKQKTEKRECQRCENQGSFSYVQFFERQVMYISFQTSVHEKQCFRKEVKVMPVLDPIATGKKINQIRKDRNISVTDIKDALGLSTTNAIYKWFRGDSMPTLDNIILLSNILGVGIADLLVTRIIQKS